MYAAAEAMMPGLRPQNLAAVARAAADVAAAMVERSPRRSMAPNERDALAAVVAENTERFRVHLAKRSTAEAWDSFDVPWDHRRTLDLATSGQYAADLLDEALWVAESLAAMFADAVPPRTVGQARVAGQRAFALGNRPGLLAR